MKAYTDGACRGGNPGDCSCSFLVLDEKGGLIHLASRYLGPSLHSNNYAEYAGLIDLLEWADRSKITGIEIYCDSALIVNQTNGEWRVNEDSLRPLRALATFFLLRGGHTLEHIKGHSGIPGNEMADRLCNAILDAEEVKRVNAGRVVSDVV